MDRPALKRLLAEVEASKVDCVVVYKVDRLSRSIRDFAKMMELFERHGVSFVSVTQQFNTTTSLGRLTLNILLSFAQFEREIISERTRDKQVAARRKGKWTGGHLILGYDLDPRATKLLVNPTEAEQVRSIFRWYLEGESVFSIVDKARRAGWRNKQWTTLDLLEDLLVDDGLVLAGIEFVADRDFSAVHDVWPGVCRCAAGGAVGRHRASRHDDLRHRSLLPAHQPRPPLHHLTSTVHPEAVRCILPTVGNPKRKFRIKPWRTL